MKNKIIIASSVLSLVASSSAFTMSSSKPNGWYFKGSYDVLSNSFSDLKLSMPSVSVGYKTGYFRTEVQLGYGHLNYREQSVYGYNDSTIADAGMFGFHSFVDFDNTTIFSPYVGMGVDSISFENDYTGYDAVYPVALLGARAYLTNNLALDFGYKTSLTKFNDFGFGSIGFIYHFN